MPEYQSWNYPDIPPEFSELLAEDKKLVIVGVIGNSATPDCNKLAAFKILDRDASLYNHVAKEGNIQFYYNRRESMLLVHFETSFDAHCMQQMLQEDLTTGNYNQFFPFNEHVRNRFARMLLFATQVCHIIVFVELSVNFDASLLSILKALKIVRDTHILKFLPKLIKNSNTGTYLGKAARLCSPRMLFLFENYPDGYETTKDAILKLEFEVEDNIYKMLRNEFIIMNNSSNSLFSIPGNKRFVFFNTDETIREDPLLKKISYLKTLLDKPSAKDGDDDDDLCELRPFKSFGKPLALCKPEIEKPTTTEICFSKRQFLNMLREHVDEALHNGFDDSVTKYKGRNHFIVLNVKSWYEAFKMLHKIFIENPDNPSFEANDPDYKLYLKNFGKIINMDDVFFTACCDSGLQKAFAKYNNPTITHYSGVVHKEMVEEAVALYYKYARGPHASQNESKLREMCTQCWENGKQQCEAPSLHGYPCILPKHVVKAASEHSSGHIFISTCNCGRTQGRREDPYTMRHANYEFYEYMAKNCSICAKVKRFHFNVFEPSINDFRAAELEAAFPKLSIRKHVTESSSTNNASVNQGQEKTVNSDIDVMPTDDGDMSQPLTAASQDHLHTNLSFDSIDNINKITKNAEESNNSSDDDDDDADGDDDDDDVKELVLQLKDKETQAQEAARERSIYRQPSTTEFLPGMVHIESPPGLLPLYPSWSLVCVGASSVYSHNTGLIVQSGFISGSNFLLPWDVQVRLEHSASLAAAFEKSRYRKMGEVFILKVFIGYEYECPRGHRFMLSSPEKVMRGSADILRDSGSKVVFNNMPIYYPCVCRSNNVAQLLRIHVVTPKAPVNIILDPKVRIGEYTFIMGMPTPPRLTQSAYWILRLPYIYQGDDEPIAPPTGVTVSNATSFGMLLAGMFGVSQTELDD